MIDKILLVVYLIIAVSMVVLILLQRGSGAQAGSGFGAGASGTVFGSQGSGNFLTKSTKYLALAFFGLSLFMSWKAVNINSVNKPEADLGVMSSVPAVPESTTPSVPNTAPAPAVAPAPAPVVPATVPAPEKK